MAHRRKEAPRDDAPFFTFEGAAYTTDRARDLAAHMGGLAGMPTGQTGAKMWRVGGATDLREMLGDEAGPRLIQARGRWKSDIADVYQRPLVRAQLRASAGMGAVTGAGLEELVHGGWAAPAARPPRVGRRH